MASAAVAARTAIQRTLETLEARRRAELAQMEARRRSEIERERILESRRREAREAVDEQARQALAAKIQALPPGQIMALGTREEGENGRFEAGEIGVGCVTQDGRVEILWPNFTRTRTTWPNISWYAGQPSISPELARGQWLALDAPSDITTCDNSGDICESTSTHTFISDGCTSACGTINSSLAEDVDSFLNQDLQSSCVSGDRACVLQL
mmetsp:Transcript_27357/g.43435  ORF Transcript_27357/g.43435 Transcript_27357/m.43435 type:complete len:211 (+) Transcript_27357:110-742(+)